VTYLPELVNNIFYERCDITIFIVRRVTRDYNIFGLLDSVIDISVDDSAGNLIEEQIESVL
jgi:hypothetical protein